MIRDDVAIVSASFPPRVCGIADYVAQFADALRLLGVRAEVVTGAHEAALNPGIVNPIVPDWGFRGVMTLARVLAIDRPKIVHVQWERSLYEQNPALPLLLPLLLALKGLPLVTTFHAFDGPTGWGRFHRAALIPLLWGSRDIVVCSERQLRAARRVPGLARRATLIPIGNVIPVVCKRPATRPPGPTRLVYFGFVWWGRNIEVLLRTLKAVLAIDEHATLDIVGGIKDEEYRVALARIAVDLGVTERVRFRGAVPVHEISCALAEADIVLLPFETGVSTGRTTLMAALAHGAPIVTMGADDNLSPLFESGVNMEIVAAGDEAGFVERAAALAKDEGHRARLTAGAISLSDSMSWSSIAARTLELRAYQDAGVGNARVEIADALE